MPDLGQATCVYGARTCYDSHSKASPETDSALLRRILPTKHYSVIRHSNAMFWMVSNVDAMFKLAISRPGKYLQIEPVEGSTTRFYVSGNYQAWRDALSQRLVPRGGYVLETLAGVAPDVFYDVPDQVKEVGRANIIYMGVNPNPTGEWKFSTEEVERHTRLCFEIITSRALSCQVHRHTSLAISMRSQRYVDEGECTCILSPGGEDHHEFRYALDEAIEQYGYLKQQGVKKEDARYVLPGAVSTVQLATANLDMWKHFIWERALSVRAQHETRHVAQMVLEQAYALYPSVFEREMQELHSHPELRTGYAA